MITPCFQQKQGIQPPAWQLWPPEIWFLVNGGKQGQVRAGLKPDVRKPMHALCYEPRLPEIYGKLAKTLLWEQ